MEHLDLAGVISTPTMWNMPAFDQQDAIYLSSSRQMLEPILEETSEDEEHAQNSWSQHEQSTSFWSSAESETGSVIRIEVNKDPDSISERDFACPAKRARRSDEFFIGGPTNASTPQQLTQPSSLDDTVLLRRYQRNVDYNEINSNSLERFLAYEACTRDSWGTAAASQQRNSTGSRRFDDFPDSDSISYQSLSRSSSLIQFESLERQLLLQEQHASMSSLGNSSPSLLSFDGANTEEGARSGANSGSNSGNSSRRGSQSSLLKRFDTSDGRLHQTYIDLDKLNFDDDQRVLFGASKSCNLVEATIGEVKSDSESSTSSGSSSGNSILTASKPSAEDLTDSSCAIGVRTGRIMSFQRAGKSSAENLSEDSGYCEPSTLRRAKSKSIPKNFDKFCEEEEEFQQYERIDADAGERFAYETNVDSAQNTSNRQPTQHSKNSNSSPIIHYVGERDICQPKINDATFVVVDSNAEIAFNEPTLAATMAAATLPSPSPSQSPPPTPPVPLSPPPPLEAESPVRHNSAACPPYYERVKNSPTREAYSLLEQRRSLTHSPSPVSSDVSSSSCGTARSSTSASTCASAASFTWLPTPIQLQQQRQQQQLLQRAQPPNKQTLDDFCASLRNSLPDIRDVLGSEASSSTYGTRVASEQNSHGLEQSSATTKTTGRISTPLDDSDIGSTSASASAHDSRSEETDAESSPETRKRIVGNASVGNGGGGSGGGAHYVSRTRISSVPSELHKLGRRNRNKAKYRYSKSSTDEDADEATSYSDSSVAEDDDFFDDSCLKIRRSCSWSERRERNLQRFEGIFGDRDSAERRRRLATQAGLGYMNASYQDLTALDYTGQQNTCNQSNLKRCSGSMDTPKSTSSADYESLICKGNFLLDELSEIYDRNASILNDKPMDTTAKDVMLQQQINKYDEMDAAGLSPRPPPRQRKHSNSSHSDLESGADEAVQHVQLTIRKPPIRQKNARKGEATNSLISESSAKTFDQDPTNLRTSYAQSLEKCNFDTRELSNTELTKANSIPKRRFHSQASATNQRNMVSSTPNLNAFDPRAEEIEDDMYVSSAHTSMHQLPQATAQKPLGILLPAGSRVSFGKEVSFCPVVSKYSWQEQSSEECNDPQAPQDGREDEETDDELLDNADATVIYNTRENELIAARFKTEQPTEQLTKSVAHIREAPVPIEKARATMILRETNEENCADQNIAAITSHEVEANEKLVSNETSRSGNVVAIAPVPVVPTQPVAFSHKSTIVHATTSDSNASANVNESNRYSDNNDSGSGGSRSSTGQARPLSIELPILSEPPTNRAHHILYASQQMLDNFERREREQYNSDVGGAVSADRRTKSVNNLSVGPNRGRMSNETAIALGNSTGGNNNNELMKNKFKDEKHPSSKGFLSRFANGFRFSLRRNKKKRLQQKEQQSAEQNGNVDNKTGAVQQQQPQQQQQQAQPQTSRKSGSRAVNVKNGNSATAVAGNKATGKQQPQQQQPADQQQQQQLIHSTSAKLVTGKPPLPKQPPRSATLPASLSNTTVITRYFGSGRKSKGGGSFSSHAQKTNADATFGTAANFKTSSPKSRSQFYTDFLESERSYYDEFENQLNSGMQANGRAAAATAAAHDETRDESVQPLTDYESARSSVSPDKTTTMLLTGNNSGHSTGNGKVGVDVGGGVAVATNGRVAPINTMANAYVQQQHNNCKIGLIETNLDTHETVISGKTRSLIDIVGPQQQAGRRLNMSAVSGRNGDANDDNDVYGDDEDDDNVAHMGGAGGRGSVVVKTTTATGSQIASVRRPHKSMEFLLDKENQKNVLPPENELQKSHDHNPAALSEHQLRVQASLQRLNIPDWFRQYNQNASRSPDGNTGGYKPGNFTRKRTTESGRWAGLNSKTTSLSSLGSQRSDRSPLLLSPSAHSHHGGQGSMATHAQASGTGAYGTGGGGTFSRWSTSHLNSSQTSPSVSQRGPFTRGGPVNSSFMSVASGQSGVIRSSFRQPYLGWRSQEKLSQRTPHERLASSLLAQQQRTSPTQRNAPGTANGDKLQPVTPEIQSSIKEVTSAIVHYVNDQTAQQQRSRSTSPNSRKCWLESSFVGIRPLDSPQTPIIESTATAFTASNTPQQYNNYSYNYNYTTYNNNNSNSSATSSLHSNPLTSFGQPLGSTAAASSGGVGATTAITTNPHVLRMNGLSIVGGGESTILI